MIPYALMAVAVASLAAAPATATIQKPKTQTVTGGICRITDDGSTLGVNNDGKAAGTFDCGAPPTK